MEDTEEPLVTHMVTMRLRRRPGSGSRVSAFEATLFEKPNHRNTCLGAVPYFETNLSHRTEGTPLVNIKCTWGSTSTKPFVWVFEPSAVGSRSLSRLSQLPPLCTPPDLGLAERPGV